MTYRFSTRSRVHAALLGPLAAALKLLPAAAQATATPEVANPITIVVGGLDAREPGQPQNSDVMIVARIDLEKHQMRAFNIPRDLYVSIPGVGYDKITRSYDYGSTIQGSDKRDSTAGIKLVEETIRQNFGLDITAGLVTEFGGFTAIVDAFGGIDVNNPYEVYDAQYPTPDYGTKEVYFPAGEQHLNGEQTLEFCRTRHQDGDDGRVMRQHLALRALLKKAKDPSIVSKLPELYKTKKKYVQTTLSKAEQLALLAAAPNFDENSVGFGSLLPYVSPGSTESGMWIYVGNWDQIPSYVEGFLNGDIPADS
jgi:LCP family protein required for cell wall assembly